MATQMITKGNVEFNGIILELGVPVLVNGRKATPFMAWVRDDHHAVYAGLAPRPNTDVRFKFEEGFGYKLEDFNTVYGKKAVIRQVGA